MINNAGVPVFEKRYQPQVGAKKLPYEVTIPPWFRPAEGTTPEVLDQLAADGWDPEAAAAWHAAQTERTAARVEADERSWREGFIADAMDAGFTAEAADAQLADVLAHREVLRAHVDGLVVSAADPRAIQPVGPFERAQRGGLAAEVDELKGEIAALRDELAELDGSEVAS